MTLSFPSRALGAVVMVGCGAPISNAFLEADQAYLSALPSAEQQSIALDPVAPPEIADLLSGIAQVNASVQELLGWVAVLSALPPTVRESDRRAWGPYPLDGQDGDWRAEIVRVDQGRFSWAFGVRAGQGAPWGDFFVGESVAGFDPQHSAGWLRFDTLLFQDHSDGDAGAEEGAWLGVLDISFDYINEYAVAGTLESDGAIAHYVYEEEVETEEGRFWYHIPPTGGASDTYAVSGQWRRAGGGRSDTTASGGDLGAAVAYHTQCWGPDGAVTYDRQAVDGYGFLEEGSAESCLYDAPLSAR